ncbi:MAG: MarR family winged helix-turn-helix transcriptional regulator [Anaerolineae bacterium]
MGGTSEPESLDRLFAEICRLKHGRVHTLYEALGLYRGQPRMLRVLWDQEGLTHTELSRQLQVQPATITKMLQRMEKAGFVVRRHDPDDQRVSRVYLTHAGRAVRDDVQQVWRRLEEEAFAGFTEEESVLLRQFFLRIRANLMQVSGGA